MNKWIEDLLGELRGLRQAKETADAQFLLRLLRLEEEDMSRLAAEVGYASFAQFLVSHDLCSPARYENFKAGVNALGGDRDKAAELGANPVIALAALKAKKSLPAFVSAVEAFRSEHNGVAPSEQASRRMLRQVDPRPEIPESLRRLSKIAELEQENLKLKAEIRKLERQIKNLEAKLSKATKRGQEATVS